jgi:hypothetical protein
VAKKYFAAMIAFGKRELYPQERCRWPKTSGSRVEPRLEKAVPAAQSMCCRDFLLLLPNIFVGAGWRGQKLCQT